VRAVIPRRNDLPGDRGVLIIAYASHKKKAYSFFLVQSEYGDIYKVSQSPPSQTHSFTIQGTLSSACYASGRVTPQHRHRALYLVHVDVLRLHCSMCALHGVVTQSWKEPGNHILR
jgi:hypothetical protein